MSAVPRPSDTNHALRGGNTGSEKQPLLKGDVENNTSSVDLRNRCCSLTQATAAVGCGLFCGLVLYGILHAAGVPWQIALPIALAVGGLGFGAAVRYAYQTRE